MAKFRIYAANMIVYRTYPGKLMMSLYFSDLSNQQLEFLYSKTLKLRNQLIMLEGTNHLVLFHTPETGVRSGFLAPFNNSHHLWATCYGPNPKINPNSSISMRVCFQIHHPISEFYGFMMIYGVPTLVRHFSTRWGTPVLSQCMNPTKQ